MQLTPPPIQAPGMFRCAQSGLIKNLFNQAGLKNALEKEVAGTLECGSPDVYWDCLTEVAAPFVAALSKADDATKGVIKKEVFDLLQQKFPDGNVRIGSSALVIYGEK